MQIKIPCFNTKKTLFFVKLYVIVMGYLNFRKGIWLIIRKCLSLKNFPKCLGRRGLKDIVTKKHPEYVLGVYDDLHEKMHDVDKSM